MVKMWFAPVLTSLVQSSHTGASSRALFVTSTVKCASAGTKPITDRTQIVIGASAVIGSPRVTDAPVTSFVKVTEWEAVACPSLAVMEKLEKAEE